MVGKYQSMISNMERECIEMAHQARLSAARSCHVELEKNGVPFDSPVSGIASGINWNETLGGKIKQIAIIPLALLFVLFLMAMTPIAYILHLRKVHKKRKETEREIQTLETELLSEQVPDSKDVESLWRLHGLDERKYSLDERMSLLSSWIDILYGKDVSQKLNLKSRVAEIADRSLKANLRCYEDMGAPHFRFASPVNSVVYQVTKELPLYQ
jgi:hypothetical protein